MPAIERSFNADVPTRLYLDSDVVLAYLARSQRHYRRSRRFLQGLFLEGRTELFISSLTWMEVLHVIRQDRFRAELPDETRGEFRLDQWEDQEVRSQYIAAWNDLIHSSERSQLA